MPGLTWPTLTFADRLTIDLGGNRGDRRARPRRVGPTPELIRRAVRVSGHAAAVLRSTCVRGTPRADLADYLVAIKALLAQFDLTGVMYGHFGAGCMHIRIDFDQRTPEGRAVMARFIHRAAELCVEFAGSMSGEDGDGRARSELLPLMYSAELMRAFTRFKEIWDPSGLLNPGVIVDPQPLSEGLALAGVDARAWPTSFELTPSHNVPIAPYALTYAHAVQRCIGVGRCRASTGGVMCPSFRATGDEKDSTRGRSRVLQEMVRNSPTVADGWRSDDVRDALDLCLSCKACSTDCPAPEKPANRDRLAPFVRVDGSTVR